MFILSLLAVLLKCHKIDPTYPTTFSTFMFSCFHGYPMRSPGLNGSLLNIRITCGALVRCVRSTPRTYKNFGLTLFLRAFSEFGLRWGSPQNWAFLVVPAFGMHHAPISFRSANIIGFSRSMPNCKIVSCFWAFSIKPSLHLGSIGSGSRN